MIIIFQTPSMKNLDRTDHIWQKKGILYKCVLCGAMVIDPPRYPTLTAWMPDRPYEPLTDEERALVPFV